MPVASPKPKTRSAWPPCYLSHDDGQENRVGEYDELKRPNIADSDAIIVPIYRSSDTALVSTLTRIPTAARGGRVASLNGGAPSKKGMGESRAAVVLQQAEHGV